jgi:osmotically-inducible protein OsmY
VAGLGVIAWILTGFPTGSNPSQPPDPSITAMPHVASDATITAAVQSGLRADPAVRDRSIQVATRGGVVHLAGVVGSAAEKDRAIRVARSVGAVKGVRAELRLAQSTRT